jgi:hypothetical protein
MQQKKGFIELKATDGKLKAETKMSIFVDESNNEKTSQS